MVVEDLCVLLSVGERQTGVAGYKHRGHAGQPCCRHHHTHLQGQKDKMKIKVSK